MKTITAVLILILSTTFNITGFGQQNSDIVDKVKVALSTGNATNLAQYFNSTVEIGFKGEEKTSYSKTQAEFIMKDFFKKNPATDFQYIHQGSSKEGMKYTIGKYTFNGGSYRTIMVIKNIKGVYLIDSIIFEE